MINTIIINTIVFTLLMFLWIKTQHFLSTISNSKDKVIDKVHDCNLVATINGFLHKNLYITKLLFIVTSLLLDLGFIYIFLMTIIYSDYKSLFIMFTGFLLRQLNQMVTKLPIPEGMLWLDSGFPSFAVTYNTTNDFFFSGHTFMALLAGLHILTNFSLPFQILSIAFILLEIGFIIVTRSHYIMDIYAAIMTYGFLHMVANNLFHC